MDGDEFGVEKSPPSAIHQSASRILNLAFVGCVGAAVLSLFAQYWWLADLAANLRFQWSFGLTVIAVTASVLQRWFIVAVCILLIVPQLFWFRASSVEPNDSQSILTVITANVYTHNRQHERIVDELRRHDADVIVVVELSSSLSDYLTRHLGCGIPAPHYESR